MGYTALFGRPCATLRAALAFGSLALFGCGGSGQLKKQVTALEAQLTAVRADQDRLEERLAAVELSSTVTPRTLAKSTTERVEHRRLKVIHLSPDDEAPRATEPSDEGSTSPTKGAPSKQRPIIRGTGDRVIKSFDSEGDETTRNDDPGASPVAELRREPRRN